MEMMEEDETLSSSEGVRQFEGMGRKRFLLSADDDSDLRSRCE